MQLAKPLEKMSHHLFYQLYYFLKDFRVTRNNLRLLGETLFHFSSASDEARWLSTVYTLPVNENSVSQKFAAAALPGETLCFSFTRIITEDASLLRTGAYLRTYMPLRILNY